MKIKFILAITFCLTLSVQAQKSLLVLNLEVGKDYKQVMYSDIVMNMEMYGQKIPMNMSLYATVSYLIQSANDTAYEMEVKYEKMAMTMLIQGMKIEINSESENEDILSLILNGMINKPFEMTMNKRGEVTDVRNVDTLVNGLLESITAEYPEFTELELQQAKEQVMQSYGEDALKGNMGMSTIVFPQYPVKKGDKWIVESKLTSGFVAEMITEYKLAKKTNDFILIKGKSKLKTSEDKTQSQFNGMTFDLSGTMVSEIKINPSTGWIIYGEIEQKIGGTTSTKENKQNPVGMQMQMNMHNKMIITN